MASVTGTVTLSSCLTMPPVSPVIMASVSGTLLRRCSRLHAAAAPLSTSARALGGDGLPTVVERHGSRMVLGYGFNGEPNYIDRVDYPIPAVRFKEDNAQIKVGSWCRKAVKMVCGWTFGSVKSSSRLCVTTGRRGWVRRWKVIVVPGASVCLGCVCHEVAVMFALCVYTKS